MKWIIHYDVVAFILIFIILVVYSSYHRLKTFVNKVYTRLLIISLISAFTDILTAYTCSFCTKDQIVINYIANIIHFLVQNAVPCLYTLFAYALIYETEKIGKKWFCIIFLPYILVALMVLSTPFTDLAFVIDDMGDYSRGKGQIFTYSVAAYYVIAGCVMVLKNMKLLGRAQRISVLLYSFECILLSFIQLLLPEYLLQEIGIAFAMFFIYITMQNPFEYTDMQTGVYNRNLFKKIINNKIEKKEDFSIICVQVEGLGYINEKFGVNNGNHLIKQVADFLQNLNKKFFVHRIANRQFALIMPKEQDLSFICGHIVNKFNRPFYFQDIKVNVNLWCHICCLQNSKKIHSMTDLLDIIQYSINEAEKGKKNSIIYASTEMLERKRRETEISQAVTKAIEEKSFQVYYQPIYSVAENKYTKMEALIRLIDENLGFIPPDEFIPLAEKNGDILVIGEIVLEKVCEFIEQNEPEKKGINAIHVNLSVVQCMQENLHIRLMNIIDKYKVPYGLLDFEITETTADNTQVRLDEIMNSFKQKGIHFSLDDFGTGYSNQANIIRYPYSTIKIDKSLVWASETNPKATTLLNTTISMIDKLEMNSLAEGIETEKQKQELIKMGCDYLQGYYFSKPLPQNEIMDFIEKGVQTK